MQLAHNSSLETRLLTVLIRHYASEEAFDKCEWIADIDWNQFAQLCHYHRLAPLIYWLLAKILPSPLPKPIAEMEANYRNNVFRFLTLSTLHKRLEVKFSRSQLTLKAYRGTNLIANCYHKKPLRYINKSHYLVPKAQLRDVVRQCQEDSDTLFHDLKPFTKSLLRFHPLEHWHSQLNWTDHESLEHEVGVASFETHWLLSCLTVSTTHRPKLCNWLDLALLTPHIQSWPKLMHTAERINMMPLVRYSLAVLQNLLGQPAPNITIKTDQFNYLNLGALLIEPRYLRQPIWQESNLTSFASMSDELKLSIPTQRSDEVLFPQTISGTLGEFVPSGKAVIDAMLGMAELTTKDYVFDLGCGDGRLLVSAASNYGVRGVGVDLNPELIQQAQARAEKAGVSHLVQFVWGDALDQTISDASVLLLYVNTHLPKLWPKLQRELKPGTRIVSHHDRYFDLWPADQLKVLAKEQENTAYILKWVR